MKNIWKWIVAVFAVSLSFFGWWFWFEKGRNLDRNEALISSGHDQSGTNEQKQSDDLMGNVIVDASNWETYQNEEYGFELKYPAGWIVTAPSKNKYNEAVSLTSGDTDSRLIGVQNQAGDNIVIHVLSNIREDTHVENLGDSVKNLEDFLSLDVS